MKRKLWLTTVICLLLIATALYFVPYPTYVDISMEGSHISSEEEILQSGDLQIKGWRLDYLFQYDRLILNTVLLPGVAQPLSFDGAAAIIKVPTEHFSGSVFWEDQYVGYILVTTPEKDQCLFVLDGQYYVGSSDANVGITDFQKTFEWFVN